MKSLHAAVLLLRTDGLDQDSHDRLNVAGLRIVQKGVQTNNGVFTPIVSTLDIAKALDILFRDPDTSPPLFPTLQSFEQTQQVQSVITRLLPAIRKLVVPSVPSILDERGKEYFIRTRKQEFNVSSLEELRPQSLEETEKLWRTMQDTLEPVIHMLHQSSPQISLAVETSSQDWQASGHVTHVCFLSGTSSPTCADFILMAFLAWIARVDMEVWTRMTQDVGGGILKDLWLSCLPYMRSPTPVQTLQWFR